MSKNYIIGRKKIEDYSALLDQIKAIMRSNIDKMASVACP